MRMNLHARAIVSHGSDLSDLPQNAVLLTVKPACLLPGDYSYTTNSDSLLRMLRQRTDLPSTVLDKFEMGIWSPKGANLPAVEISEKTLTEMGYFLD
ncbi:MAG: hypothetical protein QOH35_5861 [Acidobacteriaceae bacterium]|nr:hypothetical protein [Acidobacteriaceae bacterium]